MLRSIITLCLLAACGIAAAADSSPGASPMDKNQACMDRNVDASSGDCVIKDDGVPRHTYPQKRAPVQPAPKPSSNATPAATMRGSTSSK